MPAGVSVFSLPRIVQFQFFDVIAIQRMNAAAALLGMYNQSDFLATQIMVWVREAQGGSLESLTRIWNLIPVRFIRGLFQLTTQFNQRKATMGEDIISQPQRLRLVLENVITFPDAIGLVVPPEEVLPVLPQLEVLPRLQQLQEQIVVRIIIEHCGKWNIFISIF